MKKQTFIVDFLENLLLNPDPQGRGSKNSDFLRRSFVNGPQLPWVVMKKRIEETILKDLTVCVRRGLEFSGMAQ